MVCKVEEFSMPNSLIIILVQSPLKYVPVGNETMSRRRVTAHTSIILRQENTKFSKVQISLRILSERKLQTLFRYGRIFKTFLKCRISIRKTAKS